MLTAPLAVHAQAPNDAAVCVVPVVDVTGQPDRELDRALRAAVPLIVSPSRPWRFVAGPAECEGAARVRFIGHRTPEVRYAVEVELPGAATDTLYVDAHAGMGTFALAEALCVNALLLLGQPVVPVQVDRHLRLWLAPTLTFGRHIAVGGSEVGFRWLFSDRLWIAGAIGFEAFGVGANARGTYQYSVVQAAVRVGARWQFDRLGLAAGLGVRERTWLSHLQTQALHQDYDFDFAVDSELRASVRVAHALQLGLAARPSLGLGDVSVAAPGEPPLLQVPRFLLQLAMEIAIDL